MTSLDTTNVILAVIAVTTAAQFVLLLGMAMWAVQQLARLRERVVRFEAYLPTLTKRANVVIADLHTIAERSARVGQEIESTARGARAILNLVEPEVARTARAVHVALSLIEGGIRQASAAGAGVRAGVLELFGRRRRHDTRRLDEDAVARFEAGA